MLQHTYALKEGGPARLRIDLDPERMHLELRLDGATFGSVPNAEALREEPTFRLPEGVLRLAPASEGQLRVTLDGRLLPDARDRGAQMLRGSIRAQALAALLFGGLSLGALVSRAPYLEGQLRLGWTTLAISALLAACAFLTARRVRPAVVLALVLLAGQGLVYAVRAVANQGGPLWPVPLCLVLLLPISRGLQGMGDETTL